MLRIPCPYCGERDEAEFRFGGGEPHVARPGLEASEDAWAEYLFTRPNPKGLGRELWCHVYGCNQWFAIDRDTVTHRIHRAYRIEQLEAFGGGLAASETDK